MNRRDFLRSSGAALAMSALGSAEEPTNKSPAPLHRAKLPNSERTIARIGLGTWQVFDVGSDPSERAPRAEVLRTLVAAGAEVVDTSPMYGRSEEVLGDLVAEGGLRDKLYVATKVWTRGEAEGIAQMEESLAKLRMRRVELMQIHNLVDWRTHLRTLRRWKESGRIGAIGVTHYVESAHDDVIAILRTEPIDFVQLPLSLLEPSAADRVLKLAADRGIGFLANRPFGGGGALGRVRQVPLPPWAADYEIGSWAQFLLKWILSHPEVTCAIPGTSNPRHMADNLDAARGRLPDVAGRKRLADFWRNI